MHVVAIDIADSKLKLAKSLGADEIINAADVDPVKEVISQIGGVHGALVTAVNTKAFAQATGMLRRHGTMSLVGLPPGDFPLPIFDVVLKRLTVRGSIVGTRLDLSEAMALAAEGQVKTTFNWAKLDDINEIFDWMREGRIEGRVVLEI